MDAKTASLILIQGGIFLVILWFLNKNLLQPVLKILHQREEKTEGFLAEAEQMGKNAIAALGSYEKRLQEARREALTIKKDAILQGLSKKEEILSGARSEANRYLEAIRSNVATEVESTRQVLSQEVITLGREIAEKTLGKAI